MQIIHPLPDLYYNIKREMENYVTPAILKRLFDDPNKTSPTALILSLMFTNAISYLLETSATATDAHEAIHGILTMLDYVHETIANADPSGLDKPVTGPDIKTVPDFSKQVN